MDQEKRNIIVKEIEHWRRSKLLPEHYCDFLLNLYADKATDKPSSRSGGQSTTPLANSSWKSRLLGIVIISLICLSGIYFNSFPAPLQIGVTLLFVSACYGVGVKYRETNTAVSFSAIGAGSISLLGIGLYMLRLHEIQPIGWTIAFLALCSLVWLILGILLRIRLFHLCGWIGFIMIYGWLLYPQAVKASWIELELYWLPACFIFCWLASLFRHRNKSASSVLFIVGALLWFAPELDQMFVGRSMAGVVQSLLLVKIALGAVLLFAFRKKWIEWMA